MDWGWRPPAPPEGHRRRERKANGKRQGQACTTASAGVVDNQVWAWIAIGYHRQARGAAAQLCTRPGDGLETQGSEPSENRPHPLSDRNTAPPHDMDTDRPPVAFGESIGPTMAKPCAQKQPERERHAREQTKTWSVQPWRAELPTRRGEGRLRRGNDTGDNIKTRAQ